MGHGTKKLYGMTLLLHGVIPGGGALYRYFCGLNLEGLLGIRRQQQLTLYDQGSTHIGFGDFLKIIHIVMVDNLNRGKVSTVVQDNKTKLLAGPYGANPATHRDLFTGICGGIFEQLSDRNQFHLYATSLLLKYRLSIRQISEIYKREIEILVKISEKVFKNPVSTMGYRK